MDHQQSINLRAKKLGVLLRDARQAAGKSKKDCGEAIGVSTATIGSFELGTKPPSLPELELLAFYLDVPIEHFWSDDIKSDDPHPAEALRVGQLLELRKRIIGALLRQGRTDGNMSLRELALESGISISRIKKYESGENPVPLPELESLAQALGYSIQEFYNQQGPVSEWFSEQRAIQKFLELPVELREFIGKPVNRPYIELAQRLSGMSAENLRGVAEGLLEITI
ncbi:MAG: helix-turn-helix domain-containing protein [Anaerolineae bacterium]|nr:helix-turn-helix domain-containing protein [Anaerolineae bacterium]